MLAASYKFKQKVNNLLFISLLFCLVPFAHAAKRNAVMVSGGVFRFGESSQSLQRAYASHEVCIIWCFTVYDTENTPIKLSHKYEMSLGARYERTFRHGLALETIFGYSRSSYSMGSTAVTGLSGDGKVNFYMLWEKLKYYFNEQGLLQPYIGGGFGVNRVTFSEPVDAYEDNVVLPMSFGISVKVDRYGVFLEYSYAKSLYQSEITDNNRGDIGQYFGDLKLTGRAISLGVSRMF